MAGYPEIMPQKRWTEFPRMACEVVRLPLHACVHTCTKHTHVNASDHPKEITVMAENDTYHVVLCAFPLCPNVFVVRIRICEYTRFCICGCTQMWVCTHTCAHTWRPDTQLVLGKPFSPSPEAVDMGHHAHSAFMWVSGDPNLGP